MGIDVEAEGAVAQVKLQTAPVGREKIQQVFGEAKCRDAQALFFTSGSYTRSAKEWASGRVALFEYSEEQ
jgi:HJR/Mrr/RecB family endonuclease